MSALPVQTYSFDKVFAILAGPGAPGINIGSGAGVADEGIDIEMEEDKDVITGGADGSGMHTLRAGNRGKFAIRLLLTSPINGLLMLSYNFQKADASNWGKNVLTVTNIGGGDTHIGQQVAFARAPKTIYSKDGQMREWGFNAVQLQQIFGV